MKALGRAALILIALALTPGAAAAEKLPSGKIGLLMGVRQGLGELGHFSLGPTGGVEAGWQPTNTDRRFSFGVAWSVLWGYQWPGTSSQNASSLASREMALGLRVRILVSHDSPAFLAFHAAASTLRTSVPVPPDDKRSYWGGFVGFGGEAYLAGRYLLEVQGRVSQIVGGPTSLILLVGFSFGSG